MRCPNCDKPMASDPCPECGFLVDPRGDDIEIAKALKAVQGGSGTGMRCLASDIIQIFAKGHPEAPQGMAIDKGDSFSSGDVIFGPTRNGMSQFQTPANQLPAHLQQRGD